MGLSFFMDNFWGRLRRSFPAPLPVREGSANAPIPKSWRPSCFLDRWVLISPNRVRRVGEPHAETHLRIALAKCSHGQPEPSGGLRSPCQAQPKSSWQPPSASIISLELREIVILAWNLAQTSRGKRHKGPSDDEKQPQILRLAVLAQVDNSLLSWKNHRDTKQAVKVRIITPLGLMKLLRPATAQISRIIGIIIGRRPVVFWIRRFNSTRTFSFTMP